MSLSCACPALPSGKAPRLHLALGYVSREPDRVQTQAGKAPKTTESHKPLSCEFGGVDTTRPNHQTPAHSPNNVLVSMRNQDAVVIIDLARRELVWAWGSDTPEGPHDSRVPANGNILVFDNRIRRGWSRVLEVDPLSGSIAWHYGDPEEDRFFTRARGSSQRLPNGNTLISISNMGEAREVTPEGEIVWRFWNPRLDEEEKRHVTIRMIRYAPEMIEPLLAGSQGLE